MTLYTPGAGFLVAVTRHSEVATVEIRLSEHVDLAADPTDGSFRVMATQLGKKLASLRPAVLRELKRLADQDTNPDTRPDLYGTGSVHYLRIEFVATSDALRALLSKSVLPDLVLGHGVQVSDLMAEHFQMAAEDLVARPAAALARHLKAARLA